MQELLPDITNWLAAGSEIALATVIQTWGSAPRKAGGKMAVTPAGQLAGSVSGGCVEGAVYEEAVESLQTGRGKLLSFGVADETAWEVGLACGGNIQIFVEPLSKELFEQIRQTIQQDQAGVLFTVIGGAEPFIGRKVWLSGRAITWGHISPTLDPQLLEIGEQLLKQGQNKRLTLAELDIFAEVYLPAPQLIMVGGVHIAVALAHTAKILGYRTIVIDPRRAFGSEERFPHVDLLIQKWPEEALAEVVLNENTAVALLTHDPKIDDPALKLVLPSQVFYVGALGSKKTHASRVERLRGYGVSEGEIAKIYAPIGLDINAQTPEEIALAVMAEIVSGRRKKA